MISSRSFTILTSLRNRHSLNTILESPVFEETEANRGKSLISSMTSEEFANNFSYHAFYRSFQELAPLPGKIQFYSSQTLIFIIALMLASMDGILYYLGAGDDELRKWCGVAINFPATVFFGIATADYFQQAFFDRSKWPLLGISSMLAIIASAPTTFSTFLFAQGSLPTRLGITTLQFLGGYPLNSFGLSDALNRFWNYVTDVPALRKKLLKNFRHAVACQNNPELLAMLPEEYHWSVRKVGYVIGSIIGVLLVTSLSGYYCGVAEVLEELGMDADTSYILSLALFNAPSEFIAFLLTGIDMGVLLAEGSVDLTNIALGKKKFTRNLRELSFDSVKLGVTGLACFLGYFSNATSVNLFATCPAFIRTNSLVKIDVAYGTMLFNGIIFALSQFKAIDTFKMAYANKEDQKRYLILTMGELLKNEMGSALKKIDEKFFPEMGVVTTQQELVNVNSPENGKEKIAAEEKSNDFSAADLLYDDIEEMDEPELQPRRNNPCTNLYRFFSSYLGYNASNNKNSTPNQGLTVRLLAS